MPVAFGTPLSRTAKRLLILGAGELGKEVVLEAQRLGIECIAVDRYLHAPAMQVAHRSHVIDMRDPEALRKLVESEDPDWVVPEIEAIATDELERLEADGFTVVPTARAARLTMDREGIRRLAAEELGLPTSRYRFAGSRAEFEAAVREIGLPCVVKPTMSSSGKGQSIVRSDNDVEPAWEHAMKGRVNTGRVIVESFIDFEYEITLLTVRHAGSGPATAGSSAPTAAQSLRPVQPRPPFQPGLPVKPGLAVHPGPPIQPGAPVQPGPPVLPRPTATTFCPPIGHVQVDGDYRESWQPMAMSPKALVRAQEIARTVTQGLAGQGRNGWGVFGVELFVKGDDVWFSEVSPRPHDTGLVTLASQSLSQFALHVRAITGLPIPDVGSNGPAASAVILADRDVSDPTFTGVSEALAEQGTHLRLFGKPVAHANRRMGVVVASGKTTDEARNKAKRAAAHVRLS